MKYEKPSVKIIELNEESIILTSGCTTIGYQISENCPNSNQVDKGHCNDTGHIHAIGG